MYLSGVNSKNLTADGRVTGSDLASALVDVVLYADAGAAASIVVYDGIDAASGTKILSLDVVAGESSGGNLSAPIAITSGEIFVDITGANAEATILWK